MTKIILDLCGGTGAWSQPYKNAGYDVRLITTPEWDVRFYIPPDNVYGILDAPPCTCFASSGARWQRSKDEMVEAIGVISACFRIIAISKPKFWVLENPVGTLLNYIGPPRMYFNPCDFGDPYTKKTVLWGEFNIPKFKPIPPTEGSKMHLKYGSKSSKTKEARSITPKCFAREFFNVNH